MASRGWDGVTSSDIARMQQRQQPQSKPSKYRNVKTVVDGITFDSKREAQYWAELKMRERAGDIKDLRRQVAFPLLCPFRAADAEPRDYAKFEHGQYRVVGQYVADYVYVDSDDNAHVVDAKGKRTSMYQLKKKWLELQSGIVIEEV